MSAGGGFLPPGASGALDGMVRDGGAEPVSIGADFAALFVSLGHAVTICVGIACVFLGILGALCYADRQHSARREFQPFRDGYGDGDDYGYARVAYRRTAGLDDAGSGGDHDGGALGGRPGDSANGVRGAAGVRGRTTREFLGR